MSEKLREAALRAAQHVAFELDGITEDVTRRVIEAYLRESEGAPEGPSEDIVAKLEKWRGILAERGLMIVATSEYEGMKRALQRQAPEPGGAKT